MEKFMLLAITIVYSIIVITGTMIGIYGIVLCFTFSDIQCMFGGIIMLLIMIVAINIEIKDMIPTLKDVFRDKGQ